MRNEQNGLSFGCQILHDLHELFNLLRCQYCSRLIEDQDLVVAVEHLQDLGTLLHADGDIFNDGIRIYVQTILLGECDNFLAGFVFLQEACLVRLDTKDNVVEYGETFHQLKVLMNHADSKIICIIGIVNLYLFAVLADLAFLRLVQTEENRHQGRLAGTVLTEQSVNLALSQLKRDVVIGNNARKPLRDVQHLYGVRGFICLRRNFCCHKGFPPFFEILFDKKEESIVLPSP